MSKHIRKNKLLDSLLVLVALPAISGFIGAEFGSFRSAAQDPYEPMIPYLIRVAAEEPFGWIGLVMIGFIILAVSFMYLMFPILMAVFYVKEELRPRWIYPLVITSMFFLGGLLALQHHIGLKASAIEVAPYATLVLLMTLDAIPRKPRHSRRSLITRLRERVFSELLPAPE